MDWHIIFSIAMAFAGLLAFIQTLVLIKVLADTIAKTKGRRRASKTLEKAAKPPRTARIMVRLLVGYKEQERMLDDLAQRFEDVKSEDGLRAAKAFYYIQVVWTIAAQFKLPAIVMAVTEAIRRIRS